jgi:hypothetical protein
MARRITGAVALWLLLLRPVTAVPVDFDAASAARSRGDFAAAFAQFQVLARAAHPAAQFELSLLYLHGKGVQPDPRQAMHWLKQSALSGYQPAQSNLGVAFSLKFFPQKAEFSQWKTPKLRFRLLSTF